MTRYTDWLGTIARPLAPSSDQTVAAGYGLYFPDSYEIVDTKTLTIEDGAVMEIG